MVFGLVAFSNYDFKSQRSKHHFNLPSLAGPSIIDSIAMASCLSLSSGSWSEAIKEQPGISMGTTAAGPCLSKCGEIQHLYYCKDTRVPVEKVNRDFPTLTWALGFVQVYEGGGRGGNHTGGGFCGSLFYVVGGSTSHSDTPPTPTDAYWLIFYEEAAADLFSYSNLSRFSLETSPFKFSVRVACEVFYYRAVEMALGYDCRYNT